MTTNISEAKSVWDQHPDWGDFRECLEKCIAHGTVVSVPGLFLMAEIVRREFVTELGSVESDIWWVHYAVGSLDKIVELFPLWLPFVAFRRKGRIVTHSTAAILNKILK